MTSVPTEFRHAWRALRRSPGFAAAALTTLALGIGANAAIFSVVNGVLLRPLPYPGADRLVQLITGRPNDSGTAFAPANYLDIARGATSFESMAAYREAAFDFAPPDRDAVRLDGAYITSQFFEVFAASPVAGRLFSRTDVPGAGRVAVLAESAWRRVFGADPAVVGRTVRLGGQTYEVVGVAAGNMTWPGKPDVYVLADREVPPPPLEVEEDYMAQRGLSYFDVVARLRPGVSVAEAGGELATIGTRLARDHPENNAERTLSLAPLQDQIVGDVRRALLVLLASVGLVLLIAAGNVAHLLLARAAVRSREFAVRAALGAGTWRIVGHLLAEGLLLAAVGGVMGLIVGQWSVRLLVALAPENVPRLDEVGLDLRVVLFTTAVSLVSAVIFALAPVLQARRIDLVDSLKSGGRAGSTGGLHLLRRALVVGEVALASMLLVSAGLLLHSFWRLSRVDPGFARERVVAIELVIPEARYDTRQKQAAFYRTFLERLSATPTIRLAAAGFPRPFGGGTDSSAPFQIEGRPKSAGGNRPLALLGIATPGYFRAIGIPLRQGRDFSADDTEVSEPVVIVNEALARRYWPGQSALNQRMDMGGNDRWWRVIGIVGDHRSRDIGREPEPTLFLSYQQFALPFLTVYARSTADTGRVASDARTVLRSVDPDLALQEVRDMSEVVSDAMAVPRFRTLLIALFAALALTLAAVGIYGVVSYATAQRLREFGIRLALGATPGHLLALTLRDGLLMAMAGLALGLFGAWAVGRFLASLLYEIAPTDPLTFAAVPAALAAIALLACLRPARRAAQVDPAVTLRTD